VIVKQNGTAGSPANPTYDLYLPSDTGYVTKLNLSGPLIPQNSRARWNTTITVNAVPDGTSAQAYYSTGGTVVLWDPPETEDAGSCAS
jgi:hypothetical protein